MNTEEWVKEYFNETWKEAETNIDFSKYELISSTNSLHTCEERYEVEGKIYRLLYANGYNGEPSIEVLNSIVYSGRVYEQ